MNVLKIIAENYRNLKIQNQNFCDGINFIYGENAQGKTNLIESIWMLTGARSFRGTKDRDLVEFGSEFAKINAKVFFEERTQEIALTFSDGKRKAFLNDVPQKYPTEIIGRFRAVLFSPLHISLVSGGPEKRRKFLDAAICQLKPTYTALLIRYNQILRQRNSFLKNPQNSGGFEFLDILDSETARLGAEVIQKRLEYMNLLNDKATRIYSEISKSREKMKIEYISKIARCETKNVSRETSEKVFFEKILAEKLKKARNSDLKFGFTSFGPHKDDLEFHINDTVAKNFGSQGQQRSVALALKLAEADILTQEIGESPVILLDDVMSELDDDRKMYLAKKTENRQVFITGCDKSYAKFMRSGKIYEVSNGSIISEEQIL